MATPIKSTPKLSDNQFDKLTRELAANRSKKISPSKRQEMKSLVDKVLSNKR